MSDRQTLIHELRMQADCYTFASAPVNVVRDLLRAAATALEEAQGVPREPDHGMMDAAEHCDAKWAKWSRFGGPPALYVWHAMHDNWTQRHAAPAAPTREPVSAATPRDEQDAKRYRWLRDSECSDVLQQPILARILMSGAIIDWDRGPDALDAAIDAALAEPKR